MKLYIEINLVLYPHSDSQLYKTGKLLASAQSGADLRRDRLHRKTRSLHPAYCDDRSIYRQLQCEWIEPREKLLVRQRCNHLKAIKIPDSCHIFPLVVVPMEHLANTVLSCRNILQ